MTATFPCNLLTRATPVHGRRRDPARPLPRRCSAAPLLDAPKGSSSRALRLAPPGYQVTISIAIDNWMTSPANRNNLERGCGAISLIDKRYVVRSLDRRPRATENDEVDQHRLWRRESGTKGIEMTMDPNSINIA